VGSWLRFESTAGVTMCAGAVVALLWSALGATSYQRITSGNIGWSLAHWLQLANLHDLAANGLLTIFFLVVGLELSREMTCGTMRTWRQAALPVTVAAGGMAATSLIMLTAGFALHSSALRGGWGVPMATDIAFTLGALSLAGRRVPSALRTFFLTVAIADDILAVLLLAPHSSSGLRLLAAALGTVLIAIVVRRRPPTRPLAYAGLLVILWVIFRVAHIETALAGVVVGTLVPFGDGQAGSLLEHRMIPWSTALALPLFALVSTGISWEHVVWNHASLQLGVVLAIARVGGKVLGISLATTLVIRLGMILPSGLSRRSVVAASALCAVGLTVPLLFADAVYGRGTPSYATVTVALVVASVLGVVLGTVALRVVHRSATIH